VVDRHLHQHIEKTAQAALQVQRLKSLGYMTRLAQSEVRSFPLLRG
jgi:hypothetical protein